MIVVKRPVEENMSIERDQFRAAMARLGAAVSIITTDGPAGRHGLTVSSVCSVTDTPPTLLVCINRTSRAYEIVKANRVLCVNILTGRHEALSGRFAKQGAALEDRFADETEWGTLQTGAPALRDALVSVDCEVDAISEVGTHAIFFGRVAAISLGSEAEGLVYFNRAYHRLTCP
jgi:flavin reductase